MRAILPAFFLAIFACGAGNFSGGATFAGSTAAALCLIGATLSSGWGDGDPLKLGARGRLLPWALWIAMAVSAGLSPVPRAGRVALLLLPAFFALPGAVARAWNSVAARRSGLAAVSAVVAGVSLWSLAGWLAGASERPALPLGHHNLLAVWLVAVLPLAALSLREPGWRRWLAALALLSGLAAVIGSRSLTGAAGLACEALAAALWLGRRRLAALALGVALLGVFQGSRVAGILGGEDVSWQARAVYARAGWEAWQGRPLWGWGPGSTPWTVAEHLRPIPGVNPPGEVVGELHNGPLQLAAELGLAGLALVLALLGLFTWRRWQETPAAEDPGLKRAGLLGLLGIAVASLGSAAFAVTALPVAAAVAAGAALSRPNDRPGPRAPRAAYSILALAGLFPGQWAELHYERATAASRAEAAIRELADAVRWDPTFPLYRAQLARLQGDADLARRAAEDSRGVAAFWLLAGKLGDRQPLARACALDPLSAFAPFLLAIRSPESRDASSFAARALLAEPRLAAATSWQGRDRLWEETRGRIPGWPGVAEGWKASFLERERPAPEGEEADLTLTLDRDPALAFSLYLFRRTPWPSDWLAVPVHRSLLAPFALPSAATLSSTAPAAFPVAPCWNLVR